MEEYEVGTSDKAGVIFSSITHLVSTAQLSRREAGLSDSVWLFDPSPAPKKTSNKQASLRNNYARPPNIASEAPCWYRSRLSSVKRAIRDSNPTMGPPCVMRRYVQAQRVWW